MTNEGMKKSVAAKSSTERLLRSVLIVSLSINVFVFASLAMYGTWLATAGLGGLWRGLTSLAVWIGTFGASTLVFWKIIREISTEALRA